jgi:fructose-1-phosphate kinase PfkB-like protein
VIFDSSGSALRTGLTAHPSLVKPNLDELITLVGHELETQAEICQAVEDTSQEYEVDMVVTLGAEGAIASLGNKMYRIEKLPVKVVSSAGAGDGVLAGLALAISRHEPLERGLVYGFALAGAIVQTLATADFCLEDYHHFLDKVSILPM